MQEGPPPPSHVEYPRFPQEPRVRFETIGEAWRLMTAELGTWAMATLLTLLLPLLFAGPFYYMAISQMLTLKQPRMEDMLAVYAYMIPAGILAFVGQAVAQAGLFAIAAKQLDSHKVSIKDFFLPANTIPTHLGAGILMSLAIGIGSMFCYLPGLLLAGLFLFTQPIIIHERLGAVAAMQKSWDMLKGQMWMALAFYLVISITAGLGAFACGIGMLFSYPLYPLAITLVYRDHMQQRHAATVLSYQSDTR